MARQSKNPPANAGDASSTLGWEDHLEKETAIHSSILAWKIAWTEGPGRLQSMGSQRVRHDLATKQQQTQKIISFYMYYIGNYNLISKVLTKLYFQCDHINPIPNRITINLFWLLAPLSSLET